MTFLIHHREEGIQSETKGFQLNSKEEHCVCKLECTK